VRREGRRQGGDMQRVDRQRIGKQPNWGVFFMELND